MPAAAANVPAAVVSPGAAGAGGVGRRGVSLARESLSEKISARIGVFILVRGEPYRRWIILWNGVSIIFGRRNVDHVHPA